MRNKFLKIVRFILLMVGVVFCLSLSFRQKTNWGKLMEENVEALTTPEDNPDYPCVKAHGFCFINGIKKDKIAIVTKQ